MGLYTTRQWKVKSLDGCRSLLLAAVIPSAPRSRVGWNGYPPIPARRDLGRLQYDA
jgi:hypothetical protein